MLLCTLLPSQMDVMWGLCFCGPGEGEGGEEEKEEIKETLVISNLHFRL
jgi:hypothetical protein